MKNENRSGYKKTKVGWIPEEWEVTKLEEIASVNRGKFSARPRNDPKYYGGEYPFLQTGDVANSNGCVTTFSQTLNQDGVEVSRLFPPKTILLTIAANIGDVAEVPFEFACPDSLVAITNKKGTDQKWLRSFLTTKKEYFKSKSTQNAQANINLETIRPVILGFPPLPEQEAIAEVLECWDQGIRNLELKIEKKRNIKKGLMQKLLSGQSRLAGFSGEWETVKLGDVFKIGSGKDYKHLSTGNIPVFGTGGLMTHVDTPLHSGETVFIGRKGTIDNPFYYDGDFWTVDTLFYTYDFFGIIPKFLLPIFQKINWKKYNEASGVPSLSKVIISKIKVSLPSIEEQQAIAEVLCDADLEIEKLEAKLARWKDQKKYLLNELVTGSIRVGAA